MPRKPRVVAKPVPKPRARPQPAAIDRARDDAMAAIARQRGDGGARNVLLDKAELLLTRHWARSGWAGRERLIENAGWLVRVAAKPRVGARTNKSAAR